MYIWGDVSCWYQVKPKRAKTNLTSDRAAIICFAAFPIWTWMISKTGRSLSAPPICCCAWKISPGEPYMNLDGIGGTVHQRKKVTMPIHGLHSFLWTFRLLAWLVGVSRCQQVFDMSYSKSTHPCEMIFQTGCDVLWYVSKREPSSHTWLQFEVSNSMLWSDGFHRISCRSIQTCLIFLKPL